MDAGTVEGALVMRDLATQVIARVEEAVEKIEKRFKTGGKEAETFGDHIDRMGQQLTKFGGGLTSIGTTLSVGVTAPLLAAAGVATKFASDFEAAITKVGTLSGNTAADVALMRDAVLELAPAVGQGPQALAEALLVITSTGIKGAKALEILESSAKAASVGLGDTKDVARAVTSAVTAYGEQVLPASKATEILFKAVKDGGAEATEFAGTLGRVVGIAAQVGVSFQEVSGFIAAYTRLGVDAAEATTSLRGIMSTFLQPTKEAAVALAAVGTSIEEVKVQIRQNGLAAALTDLLEKFKGNEDAIAAVFGNVRALAGVMGAAGSQAKGLGEIIKHLNKDTDELGAAFEQTSKTASFTFNQLKADAQVLAVELGDALAPSFKKVLENAKPLLEVAKDTVKVFADLPAPIQTVALAGLAVIAALGPIAFIVGSAVTAFGSLLTASAALLSGTGLAGLKAMLPGLTVFLEALAAKGGLVGIVFSALAAPITIAVAAIVAVTYAVKQLTGSWGDAILVVTGLMPLVQSFRTLMVQLEPAIASARDVLRDLGTVFGAVVNQALREGRTHFLALKIVVGEMKESFDKFGDAIRDKVSVALNGAVTAIKLLYPNLYALGALLATMTGSWDSFRKGLKETADGIRIQAALFEAFNATAKTSAEAVAAAGAAAGKAAPKVNKLSAAYKDALLKVSKLTAANKAEIAAGIKLHKSVEVIAQETGIAVDVINLYTDGLKGATKELKAATAEQVKLKAALTGPVEAMLAMAGAAREMGIAISKLPAKVAEDFLNDVVAVMDGIHARGDTIPPILYNWAESAMVAAAGVKTLRDLVDSLPQVNKVPAGVAGNPFADFSAGFSSSEIKLATTELSDRVGESLAGSIATQGSRAIIKAGIEGANALATRGILSKIFGDPKDFGERYANAILAAIQGGGGIAKTIGGLLGQDIGKYFGPDLGNFIGKAIGGTLGKGIGTAIGSAIPVIGTLLGALGGEAIGKLLGKLFGGEQKEVNRVRESFVQAAGGLEKLNARAHEAGITLDRLLQARNAKEYAAAVKEIEAAFAAVDKRIQDLTSDLAKAAEHGTLLSPALIEAIQKDKNNPEVRKALEDVLVSGANRAAAGFEKLATNFVAFVSGLHGTELEDLVKEIDELGKKAKLAPEFIADVAKGVERLGPIAQGTFGSLLASGKSFTEAITIMGPGLEQIEKTLKAAGVNATGFLGQLLGWQEMISTHKEMFEVLSGVDDILVGLQQTGFLTQESFGVLASTVTDAFGKLTGEGRNATDVIASMQPQIQKIWELMTDFGLEVDDATKAMIDQAVAGGQVGDKFRPATDRMILAIDALITRLDAFITTLTGGVPAAAATAAGGVENELNQIKIDPVDVPIRYVPNGGDYPWRQVPGGGGAELPEMAIGGIVTQATPIVAGEAGPEAIVPLDRLENWLERAVTGRGGGGDVHVTLNLNAPVGATEEWLERNVADAVLRGIEQGGDRRARFDRLSRKAIRTRG